MDEAEGFAVAGGAALIVKGQVDRGTHDIDFFGLSQVSVDRLVPVAELALRAEGLTVERVVSNPGFTRLRVAEGPETTEVDFGVDARLFPTEPGPGFPVLSSEELAVDKILAIFGRAEARDFVDLASIAGSDDLERLFGLASQKDRGFRPQIFEEMTGRFFRLRRSEFPVDDAEFDKLEAIVREWATIARSVALAPEWQLPPERSGDVDRGLGL
ncbi:MAG: nucleotidyl transferase AbiEii/AbiGii toxin family protein [Acidimicrobiales bacterium]